MSRRDAERLHDILSAIEAIKAVSPALLETEPGVPWSDISRMRDRLAHRYFDTTHSHVAGVVRHDLDPLRAAVLRVQANLPTAGR